MIIEPLLIHPENVPKIIEDLEERYGRPELLVQQQLELVRNFRNIPENRLDLVIDLADAVRNCKNFLSNCGCSSYLDNPLLVKEVIDKLPLTKRTKWAKREISLDHRATLLDVSDWL